jgi:hypothetical protein
MKREKYISERISFFDHGDSTSVVISSKIDRWKETVLFFWILCWTACGAYLIYELVAGDHDEKMQIGLFVFVSFWLYFEYRISRVFLWRKWGMEYIKVDEDEFTYKCSVGRFGKATRFHVEDMGPLTAEELSSKSLTVNIEDSFWFIGGERIRFSYRDKQHKFGRQLAKEESKDLIRLIKKQLAKHQKKAEHAKQESENQLNSDEVS